MSTMRRIYFISILLVTFPSQCWLACTVGNDKADTKGTQAQQYTLAVGKTLATCKQICELETQCVAGDIKTSSGTCILYSATTAEQPETGKIFFTKTCTPDPVVPCKMNRTSGMKGGLTFAQIKLTDADYCSDACLYLTDCTGMTYSPGSCSLFGGIPLTTNTGDLLHSVKQPCLDTGKNCCMESISSLKAAAAPLYTLTATLQSCENVCVATATCQSVYFKNNVCYLYNDQTTTTPDSQSVYSFKTCTGTVPTTGSVTTECVGGTGCAAQQILLTVSVTALLSRLLT